MKLNKQEEAGLTIFWCFIGCGVIVLLRIAVDLFIN